MTTSQEHRDAGDGAAKTTDQARQGETTGRMRWVLRLSLALGVLALGGAYVGYTAMQHQPAHSQVSAPTPPQSGAS